MSHSQPLIFPEAYPAWVGGRSSPGFKMVNSQTGLGIPNIAVTLTLGSQVISSISQSDGVAHFSNIQDGTYNLFINAGGYKIVSEPVQVSGNITLPISLTPSGCTNTCTCDQYMGPNCQCLPNPPVTISMHVTQLPVQAIWIWQSRCLSGGFYWGNAVDQSMSSMPSCPPSFDSGRPGNTQLQGILAEGYVYDANGKGLCNQILKVAFDQVWGPFFPFVSKDNVVVGNISMLITSEVQTDSTGFFEVPATLSLNLDVNTTNLNLSQCLFGCCFGVNPINPCNPQPWSSKQQNILELSSLANPLVNNRTNVEVDLNLWSYYQFA